MTKFLFLVLICFAFLLNMGCGSVEPQNSNASANANVANAGPRELPSGMSTSPVPPSGNSTPGIPDPKNANVVANGPIPGIDPKNANKPRKPGATPTPGIDPEAARRQMSQPSTMKGPPPGGSTDKKPAKSPRINQR